MNGGLAGKIIVDASAELTLTLAPVGGLRSQAGGEIPHMRVIAQPGPDPNQTDLLVSLQNFGPGADPSLFVTTPGSEIGHVPTLSYSPVSDTYEGQISFSAAERGMGRIRAVGEVGGGLVRLQSTYRLQRVLNDLGDDVYSDDGNLSLHLGPGSLPGNEAYLVVMPTGALPGTLPPGLALVGDSYDVTASGALAELEKPAILRLRYDGELLSSPVLTDELGIYRWNPNTATWQAVPGSLDQEHRTLAAPVTALGTYALLMHKDEPWPAPTITAVWPLSATNRATTTLNVMGTGFVTATSIRLGQSMTLPTTFVSTSSLRGLLAPGLSPGVYDVSVINPDGQSGTLSSAFTLTLPPPRVDSITPDSGVQSSDVEITDLAGADFESGATVRLSKFGQADVNATDVDVVSNAKITCVLDLAEAVSGAWDVVVTNPDGQSGTLPDGFVVTSPSPPLHWVYLPLVLN
jgi:hypothetical protein